jgi:hypothetical protein
MSTEANERSCTKALGLHNRLTLRAIRLADVVVAIRKHLSAILDTELVDLSGSRGRALAEGLVAKVILPQPKRTTGSHHAFCPRERRIHCPQEGREVVRPGLPGYLS